MMHSDRSEYGHRLQHGDRGTRQWDDYNDRWEERREPRRDIPWDSYHKYSGDGHSSSERTSRSREYSDSPKMLHSKDRERSRKSPVRRLMSSPDWSVSEKKRRRFTEDDKDNYRYRREPGDKTYRQSPDRFSHVNVPKDFKHTPPQEEDFKHRKTSQESRNRHRHDEFTYKQQHDDLTYRRSSSGYYTDRDGQERSRGRSQDRTQSQDRSTKSCAKPRERNDSPSTDHDYRPSGTRFPLNGSSEQSFEHDVTSHSPAVPDEKTSTNGFQRFLNVLNKGVNVDALTKIVTQARTGATDRPCSPASFLGAGDSSWSPSCFGGQQGGQQYTQNWSESEESHRLASPQQRQRSFSPKGSSLSDEKPPQRSDEGRSHFKSNSRSRSPSVVEKITLTPEDEHKHRQMQDVLQAIGMDLGFEELGQMSHRIQERLYGKKESDWGRHHKGSGERETRPAFSPKGQSRSSPSSRSSVSPLTQDYSLNKDSYSTQSDVTEIHHVQMHQAVEYGQKSSSSSLQDSEKCETNSLESTLAFQTFSPNATHAASEPPPTPVMPTYSPVNYSPMLYPGLPPALPPNFPPVDPRFLFPHLPPFLPYTCVPPLNVLPGVLSQTRQLLPQQLSSHQPPYFNFPGVNPIQPLNTTQKSKTLSRPRCLQVIETKQPG